MDLQSIQLNTAEVMENKNKMEELLKTLEKPENWSSIPLLNYTSLHELKDFSIVRFRGMIQDMMDAEIYLERYEVTSKDGQQRIQDGKYRDCLVLKAGEEVNFDSQSNVQGERRALFLVSMPGINKWTSEFEQQCNEKNIPKREVFSNEDASKGVALKRPAPEDKMDTEEENSTTAEESNKRHCVGTTKADNSSGNSSTLAADYLINSPIADRPGKACLVKIYDDFEAYALNSFVDVLGFLSVDPSLDASSMEFEDYGNLQELQAQHPPPSLIPRLHAISIHTLTHSNPLLDARLCLSPMESNLNMLSVQKDLRMLLTLCLFNDDFAADYLLSHLISRVYSRSELQSIGKFALNLCNLPQQVVASYTKQLYDILELLIPASHCLPMTLDNMNTAAFVPKKDYETNKLVSGLLQLAPHTHLVLDETHMQQGKLEASGVLAIQNLAHLINSQQIKCNFQYYDIDYNVDIPVLVLSEGKSMLPSDFVVPLQTDGASVAQIEETLKAAHHYLQPARLEQFRRFLTMAKTCEFDMNTEQSEMIQNDFVEMRRTNVLKNADDLHSLLVLSRLLAIARGKTLLDKEAWELAKEMELKRRQRIEELPKSNRIIRN